MTEVTGYQLQHLTQFWRQTKLMWPSAILGNGSLRFLASFAGNPTAFSSQPRQTVKPPAPSLRRKPRERCSHTRAPSRTSPRQGQGSTSSPKGWPFSPATTELLPGRSFHKAAGQGSSRLPWFSTRMRDATVWELHTARWRWGGKAPRSFQVLSVHVEIVISLSAASLRVSPSGQSAPLPVYLF